MKRRHFIKGCLALPIIAVGCEPAFAQSVEVEALEDKPKVDVASITFKVETTGVQKAIEQLEALDMTKIESQELFELHVNQIMSGVRLEVGDVVSAIK